MLQFFTQWLRFKNVENNSECSVPKKKSDKCDKLADGDNESIYFSCQCCHEENCSCCIVGSEPNEERQRKDEDEIAALLFFNKISVDKELKEDGEDGIEEMYVGNEANEERQRKNDNEIEDPPFHSKLSVDEDFKVDGEDEIEQVIARNIENRRIICVQDLNTTVPSSEPSETKDKDCIDIKTNDNSSLFFSNISVDEELEEDGEDGIEEMYVGTEPNEERQRKNDNEIEDPPFHSNISVDKDFKVDGEDKIEEVNSKNNKNRKRICVEDLNKRVPTTEPSETKDKDCIDTKTNENSFPLVNEKFDRELFMLNVVFPELHTFCLEEVCDKLGKPTEFNFKVLDIAWKNILNQNYIMWSRSKSMDMAHMILVLRTLGQWHGINLVFQVHEPNVFQGFTEKLSNILPELATGNFLNVISDNMEKVIGILEKTGYHNLAHEFKAKMGSIGDILLGMDVDNYVVSFHADCWIDNIRFKYSLATEETKPIDVCFSNFQLSMMDSPIRDLSYIIYTYSDRCLLEDFNFLIQVYHNALSDTIELFGSDTEKIFPLGKLKKEWKKYGMFGVILSLFEMFDDEDILITEEENSVVDLKDQEHYNNRVVQSFIHFGENFL